MFPELTRDDVFRLETKRLWLRWPRSADAAALVALAAEEPSVADSIAEPLLPRPCGKADADRFILSARRDNTEGAGLKLALALRARPQEAIGALALTPGPAEGIVSLGFWMGLPYRGEGFMAEAVEGLLRLVFSLEGFAAVEAALPEGAEAAARVLRHVGFEKAGAALWRVDRTTFLSPYAGGRSLPAAQTGERNRARRPAPVLAMAEP